MVLTIFNFTFQTDFKTKPLQTDMLGVKKNIAKNNITSALEWANRWEGIKEQLTTEQRSPLNHWWLLDKPYWIQGGFNYSTQFLERSLYRIIH